MDRLGYGDHDGRYERDYDEDDEDARLVGVRSRGCYGIRVPRQLTILSFLGIFNPL